MRPPLLDAFFDLLLHPLLGRLIVAPVRPQIILGDEMSRMIVRVLITLTMAQPLRAAVARVPEMRRRAKPGRSIRVPRENGTGSS